MFILVGTPRSTYETSTLDRSPKKPRGVSAAAASMEAIPTAANANRYSAAFTTSPTSPTPIDDDPQNRNKANVRRPIGGIAVLPPMEMKRIEDQRKTPTPTTDSFTTKQPQQRQFSSSSAKSPVSETSEVSFFYLYLFFIDLNGMFDYR